MSRAGYFLSQQEQEALDGLPLLARLLYLVAIRSRMDKKTKLVGMYPKVSWRAFTEWLEVEGMPGIKAQRPSEQQVRRSARHLEKQGLVQMRSVDKQLIMHLPMAVVGFSAANKADRLANMERSSLADTQQQRVSPGYTGAGAVHVEQADSHAGGESDGQADTHHNCTDLNSSLPVYTLARDDDQLSVDQWIAFWRHEHGYPEAVINTPVCVALFEHWAGNGRTVGMIRRCISMGMARNAGRMPDNPCYFRSFVDAYVRELNQDFQRIATPCLTELKLWNVGNMALVVAMSASKAERLVAQTLAIDVDQLAETTQIDADQRVTVAGSGRDHEFTAEEVVRLSADKQPVIVRVAQ